MATPNICRGVPRAIRRTRWDGAIPRNTRTNRSITTAAVEPHEPEPYLPETPGSVPTSTQHRRNTVREAKPFSDFLTDTFARQHDYLRISLTERCNLRCLYCMPEEGIQLQPPQTQLTTAEVFYLSQLFVNQGVNKIRLTGGEPTVRKDIVPLMQRLGSLRSAGLNELALTTNGISLWRKLDAMAEAGLTGVNISLDTLDPFQFQLLTRRQGFDAVMKSINRVQEMNNLGAGIKLKINCVVMRGLNDHQILPFVEMTREQDVEVRFIEYMPFGGNKWSENKMLPYQEMLDIIRTKYPDVGRLRDKKNDTSKTWAVPGFAGRVGFITSMTHNFCGSCNRLRITSDGNLKVCLHGETEVSLRDLLRSDHDGLPMDDEAFDAIRQLELDRRQGPPGLRFDGVEGWISKESQLLEVIGKAVKRKKAKHAGMGALENLKNRPMILIGETRSALSPSSHRPWSRVPAHLLHGVQMPYSHIRPFSSSARGRAEKDGSRSQSGEKPSFASTFGFQSLSGLFQEAPKPRYSRPKVREEEKVDFTPVAKAGHTEERASNAPPPSAAKRMMDEDYFQAAQITQGVNHDKEPRMDNKPAVARGRVRPTRRWMSPRPMQRAQGIYPLGMHPRIIAIQKHEQAKHKARDPQRQPNPFDVSGREVRSPQTREKTEESAWGIGKADEETLGKPGAAATVSVDQESGLVRRIADPSKRSASGKAGPAAVPIRSSSKQPDSTKKAQASVAPQTTKQVDSESQQAEPRLTHLTSSGEAHMVDVGAKAATRRVAVATATVAFSNSAPFQLIFENSNKKGDVLGVARIAGIMAAKRTADLIPLCHPIPITKVEADVKLVPADALLSELGFGGKNHRGVVSIEIVVETFGPTGVEMEALTAVSGAALTVYDMCKAVDRSAKIQDARVVFKSGGRSGDLGNSMWLRAREQEWFGSRGLEVPRQWFVERGLKVPRHYETASTGS